MVFEFLFQSLFRGTSKKPLRNKTFEIARKVCPRTIVLLIILFPGGNLAMADDLPDLATCQQLDVRTIDRLTEGWCLMINPRKGNCLACHFIDVEDQSSGLALSGNVGPILKYVPEKYSDQLQMIEYLNDPVARYPDTIKPPYGKHRILSETEIEAVVGFFWLLNVHEK